MRLRFLAALLLAAWASSAEAGVICSTAVQSCGGSGGGGGASGGTIGEPVDGGTATRVLFVDGSGNLADDADMTFVTDRLTVTNATLGTATVSALTATRVTFAGVGGLLSDDADMTFVTDTLTITGLVNTTSLFTGVASFGSAAAAANSINAGTVAGCVQFEGSSADTIETNLCVTNPTGLDQSYSLPNTASASGILMLSNVAQTVSGVLTFNAAPVFNGVVVRGQQRSVEAVTTTKTPTDGEDWETYTNTGDADGATVTLRNDPPVGSNVSFAVTVAQTLTIVPSAGETLFLGADQCVVSITSNVVGSTLEVVAATGGSGGVWMATRSLGTWTCND